MVSAGLDRGTVLGKDFRIVRALSQGGMGAVYVAEQLSTGVQRAVKVMRPELVADARQRERFVQEARIGAQIESDHIVQVISAGVDADSGIPFLAMELLDGEDLAHHVKAKGALRAADVREIFRQLGHAVAAAHARGIVHRDLKPENIFLARSRRADGQFTIKVLDFGIAKLTSEARSASTAAVGTPFWLAPEQTARRGQVAPQADVWALGLIAFYLLTGRIYWESAGDEEATMQMVIREMCVDALEPASARAGRYGATVPSGFDDWFVRCVNREVALRFADANAAVAALDPLLAAPAPSRLETSLGDSISAYGAPTPQQPARQNAPAPPTPPRAAVARETGLGESVQTFSPGSRTLPDAPARAASPPKRGLLVGVVLAGVVVLGGGGLGLRAALSSSATTTTTAAAGPSGAPSNAPSADTPTPSVAQPTASSGSAAGFAEGQLVFVRTPPLSFVRGRVGVSRGNSVTVDGQVVDASSAMSAEVPAGWKPAEGDIVLFATTPTGAAAQCGIVMRVAADVVSVRAWDGKTFASTTFAAAPKGTQLRSSSLVPPRSEWTEEIRSALGTQRTECLRRPECRAILAKDEDPQKLDAECAADPQCKKQTAADQQRAQKLARCRAECAQSMMQAECIAQCAR